MLDEDNKLPQQEAVEKDQPKELEIITASKEKKPKKESTSDKAIEEIETKIAKNSEKIDQKSLEMEDYEKFEIEELVSELGKLIKENSLQNIQQNVKKIKSVFNVKFGELQKTAKKKFLEEGGDIVDFKYDNPIKSTYNSILYDLKLKRKEFLAQQEKELNDNLKAKLEIIEELKNLIDNAEGSTMYKLFKEIQNRWNEIGPIPRSQYSDTWKTYQHHVERFYDLLHLNNDLRELDFKHNLEEKLKLVERAEELAEKEDVGEAFKELQVLHKLWKEEIGPVERDKREEVWNRFSEATKKIHDKRHHFFNDLKLVYQENIDKKMLVLEEIEAIDYSNNTKRSDWQKSMKELDILRDRFFNIGKVPKSKNDEIWKKFKSLTREFNKAKNKFFKDLKKEQLENLNKKKLLVEQAELHKDSEDWDATTELMKKIQADWKNIGHIPREHSDKLWKKFKAACNHYFDRLHAKKDAGNKEQIEVFNKKKDLLQEIKEAVEDDTEITMETVKDYFTDWREMGRVPYEKKHIEAKFNKVLDKITESTDIDKQEIEMMKFENLINSYLDQKNYKKLESEQFFIRKKIDETTREIQQLENNVGFISNASDDNPLIININNQIEGYKEKLEIWKAKLDYLRKLN